MLPIIPGLTGLFLLIATGHEGEVRHANAHTHGVGEAILTIQGETLSFEMSAPAANFVTPEGHGLQLDDGSEHSDDFSEYVLEDFIDLPASAGCVTEGLDVEIETRGEDHHDEDHHEHEDEHADHHEDEADDEHAGHSDILVSINARCSKPEKIKSVDLSVFERWTGFTTVKATFLTETGATAKSLTKGSSKITRP